MLEPELQHLESLQDILGNRIMVQKSCNVRVTSENQYNIYMISSKPYSWNINRILVSPKPGFLGGKLDFRALDGDLR